MNSTPNNTYRDCPVCDKGTHRNTLAVNMRTGTAVCTALSCDFRTNVLQADTLERILNL